MSCRPAEWCTSPGPSFSPPLFSSCLLSGAPAASVPAPAAAAEDEDEDEDDEDADDEDEDEENAAVGEEGGEVVESLPSFSSSRSGTWTDQPSERPSEPHSRCETMRVT